MVRDSPVAHQVAVLTAEGAAEAVNDDCVAQAGGRGPGAEPGYVIQAPEQQGDREDLGEPQRRMPGVECPPGKDRMPATVRTRQCVHTRHRLVARIEPAPPRSARFAPARGPDGGRAATYLRKSCKA